MSTYVYDNADNATNDRLGSVLNHSDACHLMAEIFFHLLIHHYIIKAPAHQLLLHIYLLLTLVCCVSFFFKAAGSELYD